MATPASKRPSVGLQSREPLIVIAILICEALARFVVDIRVHTLSDILSHLRLEADNVALSLPVHLLGLRQLVLWAAALGGLATLFVMAPRQRPYAYILVAVLGCSLPYIVVQPMLRYRYMISTLLIFFALDGAFRLIAHIRRILDLKKS